MKTNPLFRSWMVILLPALFICSSIRAEEPALRYVDALELQLINQGFDTAQTLTPYTRVPAYMQDSVRQDWWDLTRCSTGLAIRFATDSKTIGVNYEVTFLRKMPHMTDTGIYGADLYRLTKDGKWKHVNSARAPYNNTNHELTKTLVSNLSGEMSEYMLFLPLYDGVNWMKIGVDSAATITKPLVDLPRTEKPRIVFYGTSIMQGGCATRPGMTSTNMICRDLQVECVNIGTSGQAKMDYSVARMLATMDDVMCFVIDPVPNCTKDMCDTLTYDFIKLIREKHPTTPILMVEGLMYPYWDDDSYFTSYLPAKNEMFRKNFDRLVAEGDVNLYYMTCEGMLGKDNEGTVDGVHLTDIGFRAYSDKIEPILKSILADELELSWWERFTNWLAQ